MIKEEKSVSTSKELDKTRSLEITNLADERLMRIDPTAKGFYDKVLHFRTKDKKINSFIEIVRETQEVGLVPFWRPVMDPTEIDGKIVYQKGKPPAVGHSYKWWKDTAEQMLPIQGNIWLPGSEYQYYADKVDLINQYVAEGHDLEEAIEGVVLNSAKFGHFADSEGAQRDFETTGSRKICGRYDLGNCCKLLRCTSKKDGGYWLAGSFFFVRGDFFQLAGCTHDIDVNREHRNGLGWLIVCNPDY